MWDEFFLEISVNFCGTNYVEKDLLTKEMDKKLDFIDEPTRKKLYYLLDYEGDTVISDSSFSSLMKIWACFSANDINNDNELDINEIKTLFWLFDGVKPSKDKIDRETKIMDADGNGTVDRLEWLKYLCSGGSGGNGKDYYDFRLREMFDRCDKKKLGSL